MLVGDLVAYRLVVIIIIIFVIVSHTIKSHTHLCTNGHVTRGDYSMLHTVITGVVFSPVQAGEHVVHVTRAGNEIAGSPITVTVSDSEVACVDGVKVYGRGLSEGQTGQPCQFYIDTSDAGQ